MTRVRANLIGAAILGAGFTASLTGLIAMVLECHWRFFSAWRLHLQGFHYAWGRLSGSPDPMPIGVALLAGIIAGAILVPGLIFYLNVHHRPRLLELLGKLGGIAVGGCIGLILALPFLGFWGMTGYGMAATVTFWVGAALGSRQGSKAASRLDNWLTQEQKGPSAP